MHAKTVPDDYKVGLWEAEASWLRKDFGATVRTLQAKKANILQDSASRLRCEDRMIRSLARLKRLDEATRLAQDLTARDGNPLYEAVVAVISGDAKKTAAALETCTARGFSSAEFHADADIGPALRAPMFSELLKLYPAPADVR
jgi:hypothetical protein